MSKPINQHDIPATYSRKFAIKGEPSFIWCYYDEYNKSRFKKLSVDSKFFKTKDFYTDEHKSEPYIVEKQLGTKIEPSYNTIIKSISNKEISEELVSQLSNWIYYSMTRTKAARYAFGRYYLSLLVPSIPENINIKYKVIGALANKFGKEAQLTMIFDDTVKAGFFKRRNSLQWIILECDSNNQFITSSHPGYSIEINNNKPDLNTINFFFKIENATYIYPLSSKHCLIILPNRIAKESIIKYTTTSSETVRSINHITYTIVIDPRENYLLKPYLLCSNKNLLENIVQDKNALNTRIY